MTLASVRLGLNLVLAYRFEALVKVLSASIVALLNWCLWTAIFQGHTTIAGRTQAELTTYVVVAWVITTFYGTRVDEHLSARFRTGDIGVDLIRPWSIQQHLYFRDLGRASGALVLTTVPLALWTGLLLPLRLPEHLWTLPCFLLSLFLAHAISFGFAWLVGIAAFALRNSSGLAHLKATLISVFSGALIPLDLYPEPLRSWIMWLPLQGMSHTPADIFVERHTPGELVTAIAVQGIWAGILAIAGWWAFHKAVRNVVIQGG